MASKKKNPCGLPGFERDPETGRYIPVAVDFPTVFGYGTKRSNPSNSSSKKTTGASTQAFKFRKLEDGVRKELFKIPTNNQQKTTENKNIKPKTPSASNIPYSNVLAPSNNVSDSTSKKQSEKKRMKPIIEQSEFHPNTTKEDNKENIKTPTSHDSEEEFLRLERLYKTPKIIVANESPVSSVCNLFENKMLLNGDSEDALKNRKEIIGELRKLIEYDQELWEDTSKKIQEVLHMQAMHKQNFNNIMTLIDKLDDKGSVDTKRKDENSAIRRSLRLQNKSPKDVNRSLAGSPVILKSGDLRKSTLTKSLVFKCQKYQIESPRIRNALEMYNATRSTCSALLTPRISNMRNSLSMKVQQQCLMLQYSPDCK